MPGALKLGQPVEHVREAEVDVRRRRIDPELDAQRAAELQLALELALRQHVHGVPRQLVDAGHDRGAGARLSIVTASSSSAGSNPNTWPRNESSPSYMRRRESARRKP